jgi:hypothetical protein
VSEVSGQRARRNSQGNALRCLDSFFSSRWPEPSDMLDAYRPTWLLKVLVPCFDEMLHRLGATAAISRKPFLPIVLRVPLLAGLAIAMSDPSSDDLAPARRHPRPQQPSLRPNRDRPQNGIRKSGLTLTAHLRLRATSVSKQGAQRRSKSRNLTPRCQATMRNHSGEQDGSG